MAILIRPVREQLEHDRVIRALQAKNRRKFEIAVNLGEDRVAPVKVGPLAMYPDLVYVSAKAPKKLQGLVEVETGESVNGLEAKAQWANFGRVRAPFHLYVPVGSVDVARRLCEENQVAFAELWSYVTAGDEVRFALVQRTAVPAAKGDGKQAARRRPSPKAAAAMARVAGRKAAKPAARVGKGVAKSKKPTRRTPARKAARPAAKAGAKARKPAKKTTASARTQKKR